MGKPIFDRISSLFDNKSFQEAIHNSQQKIFDEVVSETQEIVQTRINFDSHYFSQCHPIGPIIESANVLEEIKGIIVKYVISQSSSIDCTKEILRIISGSSLYTKDMNYDIKEIVFNFYMQYDRTYAGLLALKTGMNYFIYLGGTIRDSRDFCMAHNAKVWSREEANKWRKWTPNNGKYPDGYEIKQKETDKVPTYIDFPDYFPLIDLGGYNCRHHLGYISEDLAIRQRPDLKK